MQPYIFRNASIIGIKILIAPLIFRTCCPFFIIPVIVDAKCYYIFLSILNVRSQVEADSHHAIFVQTDMMTIDIKIRPLTNSFELYKDLLIFTIARQTKMLPIPHNRIGQFINT